MSVEERLEKLEQLDHTLEQDTIIPQFQNPDVCVFCTDKESLFYELLKATYEEKNNRKVEKQNRETCIHNTDNWLKYSYRTAGFIRTAFREHRKNPMTGKEIIDLLENKEQGEKLLKESYDSQKSFTCAGHLYLKTPIEVKDKRYSNAFTIEDDIAVQDKILQNKLKTYYTTAIEVLQAYGDSLKS